MPSTTNAPEKLRPYIAHGVFLNIPQNLNGVVSVPGDCPWCGKEGKFNVTIANGLWRCIVCNLGTKKKTTGNSGGNVYTFLCYLHELSMKATVADDYRHFAAQRGLLYPDTLRAWGVCKSVIDGTWIIPGYNVQTPGNTKGDGGKIVTIYRWIKPAGNDKPAWCATAGLSHGLHGPDIPTPVGGLQTTNRPRTGPVYRCGGVWDGMALWEILQRCKVGDEGHLMPTSNLEASLLWDASVIAVPGESVFQPSWASVLASRPDYSMYDSDHPKERPPKSGRFIQGGLDGTMKAIDLISHATTPPKECKYVRWGQTSFHDPALKDGYDVRDHLIGPNGDNTLIQRIRAVETLLAKLQPIPQEWLPGRTAAAIASGGMAIQQEKCEDWKTVLNALRGVLKVTPGIERTFAAMLASIISVPSTGDQLWLMVLGPPSSAKSTLCEAISANRTYVLPKDTLTGLFSGWQMGLEKDQNLSLAGEMANKTLVIKDADTVLQSPMLGQIMSQLRALYDRCVRTQFKNKMSKDWEGLNTTVILCGTATLLQLDAAEKGARYLTVDIQPDINYDLEDEITIRVANRAFRDMTIHANGIAQTRDSAEMLKLKQVTAGYISYLRENATRLIEAVQDPTGSSLPMCGYLATYGSYMRCRPPKKQSEKVEREMPYRLVSQLVRLARGLAVVFGKTSMDSVVMDHVRCIALNTAQGKIMGLCDYIRACGPGGCTSSQLGLAIGEGPEETLNLLRFLRKIHAVEMLAPPTTGGVRTTRPRWRLSPRLNRLYDRIFDPIHGRSSPVGLWRAPHQEHDD